MTSTPIKKINFDDGELLPFTLSSESSGLITQLCANLVETQQQLSLTKIDVGIAENISNYQQRVVQQAKNINSNIIPSFICTLADISNFSALMDALTAEMNKNNEEILAHVKDFSVEVSALTELATTYQISASALQTKMSQISKTMLPLMKKYSQTLAELEELSEEDVASISAEVDTLNKATAENIAGIISSGKDAGKGVADIGRAIISIINIADKDKAKVDDKDKKNKAKGDDKDNKGKLAPEDGKKIIEYAISGLTSISGGTAGARKSADALVANNIKLAAAYQRLAQANSVLSVAKSVDAQNVLFVDSNTDFSASVGELSTAWQSIITSFQSNAVIISEISAVEDIQRLKVAVGHSNQKWKILSDQINEIKQSFSGSGSLPDA